MPQTAQVIPVDTRPMASKDHRSVVFWAHDQLGVNVTLELLKGKRAKAGRAQGMVQIALVRSTHGKNFQHTGWKSIPLPHCASKAA